VNTPNSKCPSFEGCSAPLCPMDDSCKTALWYSDEPICGSYAMRRLYKWIRVQRKIVKKLCTSRTYYTVAMLEITKRVTPKSEGIDPDGYCCETEDNPDRDPIKAWITGRGKKIAI